MLIWILFIAIEIYRNYYIIEVVESRPDYLQSFIIRGIAAILHGVLVGVTEPSDWYPILLYQALSFWILFDISLNLVRRKPILYKGETSGYLDRLPLPIYVSLKIVAVIVLILVLL